MNKIWQTRLAQSEQRLKLKKQKRKKITNYLLCFLLVLSVLNFFYPQFFKRLIYPFLYGKQSAEKLEISAHDNFADFPLNTPAFIFERNNMKYKLFPKTKYSVTGKIGYIDYYDGWWNRFYRGFAQGDYINLVPLDIFMVIGNMAKPEIYDMFEFDHEERLGIVKCKGVKYKTSFFSFYTSKDEAEKSRHNYAKCNKYINEEERNNYHPIPANEKINKALHLLKPGDIVHIEGILVDVPAMGLVTGTRKQQHHKYIMGGYNPGMCFILYTTKIIVNNYVYE